MYYPEEEQNKKKKKKQKLNRNRRTKNAGHQEKLVGHPSVDEEWSETATCIS
jgi:hypothetical protein